MYHYTGNALTSVQQKIAPAQQWQSFSQALLMGTVKNL